MNPHMRVESWWSRNEKKTQHMKKEWSKLNILSLRDALLRILKFDFVTLRFYKLKFKLGIKMKDNLKIQIKLIDQGCQITMM